MTEVHKDFVVLAWIPPPSDPFEPITGYQIEKFECRKFLVILRCRS